MAGLSSFGRKLVAARIIVLVLAVIVMAFSLRANLFTEWFFHADKFPFGLSLATILIMGPLLVIDMVSKDAFTGRAQIQGILLGFLSVFWLAFNAFTTSRYVTVPMDCYSAIPAEMPDMQSWCVSVQVVKGFIWVEWVFITVFLVGMARFVHAEYSAGNKHVLKVSLLRYDPYSDGKPIPKSDYPFAPGVGTTGDTRPDSDFLQYEKSQEQSQNSVYYQTQRYEAPSSLQSRNVFAPAEPSTPSFYADQAGYAGVGMPAGGHYTTTSQAQQSAASYGQYQ